MKASLHLFLIYIYFIHSMNQTEIDIIHLSAQILYMIDKIIQNEKANTKEHVKFNKTLASYNGEELKMQLTQKYAWVFS